MYGICCWHIYTNLHVGTFRKKSNIGFHLHKFQANLHPLVEFSHIHAFNGQNTFTKCPLLSQIPNFPYICHISEFTTFTQIYNLHTFPNYGWDCLLPGFTSVACCTSNLGALVRRAILVDFLSAYVA